MKIAVWHNLPSGGGKRALYYHVRGLVERGHALESWRPSTADSSYLPLDSLILEHVIGLDAEGPTGQSGRRRFARNLGSGPRRMRAMDRVCRQCAGEIDRGGFDLLFANTCVWYQAPRISRHSRTPSVLYLGEPDRILYEANPFLPWIARPEAGPASRWARAGRAVADLRALRRLRIAAREEWLNAQAADTLLVNSYYSRETICRVYGRDARVCYLGIDTALFHDLGLPRERFVLGLGAYYQNKGIDRAIEAIAHLPEPRPALVWIGNMGSQSYARQMADLARARGVDFQPRRAVPDAEVVDTLNRAALLLYTSRLEPFGLAPLEANACGTPVVAMAEGGIRETVRDGVNGFLVEPTPRAAAAAMRRILDDPDLASRLGRSAREYVEAHWSLDASIDRLEACLHEAREYAAMARTCEPGGPEPCRK